MVMHMVTIIFISIKGLERNMTIFKLEHGRNRKAVPLVFFVSNIFFFVQGNKKKTMKTFNGYFNIGLFSLCCVFSRLDLRNETLRWENDDQPKSICSEPCPAGHVHNHQDQCCWSCVKCREEFEFVKNGKFLSILNLNGGNFSILCCDHLSVISCAHK